VFRQVASLLNSCILSEPHPENQSVLLRGKDEIASQAVRPRVVCMTCDRLLAIVDNDRVLAVVQSNGGLTVFRITTGDKPTGKPSKVRLSPPDIYQRGGPWRGCVTLPVKEWGRAPLPSPDAPSIATIPAVANCNVGGGCVNVRAPALPLTLVASYFTP